METVSRAFSRVNHGDFWRNVANVATLGVYDIVSNDDEKRRAFYAMQPLATLLRAIIFAYEYPTKPSEGGATISMPDINGVSSNGMVVKNRADLLSKIPKELLTVNAAGQTVPTDAAYIWAKMRYAIDFAHKTPQEAAKPYGVQPLEVIDYGKFDWSKVWQYAIVAVSILATAILTGGIGIAAIGGGITGFKNIEASKSAQLASQLGLTGATLQAAAENDAKAAAVAQAAADQARLANFLSFENPYFIMIAMAIATVILFVVFKYKKS